MTIKLSICIPTYNRAEFIGETLESIISQATEEIEIVISDNASTDNTEEIVRNYQQVFPRILYYRWNENMGADKNYIKVVELAKGDYCWLMGSDDNLKNGALNRVLLEINHGYDIYVCNRTECDFVMKPLKDRLWLSQEVNDEVYELSNDYELLRYLGVSNSVGALFSYLSSIILKREKWTKVIYNEEFTGSAYAHVFMLFSIIQLGARLKYIKESLILCRGGNDSFTNKSLARRVLLDIDGYSKLTNYFFLNNPNIHDAVLEVLRRECNSVYFVSIFRIIKIKAFSSKEDWNEFYKKWKDLFGFHIKIFIVNKFKISRTLIMSAIKIKKKVISVLA